MRKDFVKRTLKNGIVVYLYADKNLKRTIASYNIKYGTHGFYNKFYYDKRLCEVPYAMAHFLEHMLIEKSKYGNMLMRFKEKSYETNGLTYAELTSYYFIGIKDTRESIKELIHMVDDVCFTEEDVEDVKHAIMEEVTKNDDNPYSLGFNLNRRNSQSNYEVVHSSCNVLGTKKTTKSISYDQAKLCYDAFYNDENKFLVIGGNFEIKEMVDFLESVYEDIPRHPNKMELFSYEKSLKPRKDYDEILDNVSCDHAIVTYRFKNDFSLDPLLVDLYLYIFNKMRFASDTKLVSNLIKNEVIKAGISCTTDFFDGNITQTYTADIIDLEKFIKAIEGEFNTKDLDHYYFDLIKRSMKVSELNKMDYIYRSIARFPTGIDFSEKLYAMAKLDEITLDGMKDLIEKIDFSIKTVTVIKKKAD